MRSVQKINVSLYVYTVRIPKIIGDIHSTNTCVRGSIKEKSYKQSSVTVTVESKTSATSQAPKPQRPKGSIDPGAKSAATLKQPDRVRNPETKSAAAYRKKSAESAAAHSQIRSSSGVISSKVREREREREREKVRESEGER